MLTFLETIHRYMVIQRANLRLRYAARLADRAHRKYSERFYVMPDQQDRLIVMRRNEMRRLRRYGLMDNRVRMRNLVRESFYFTEDRAGVGMTSDVREAKRIMYLEYILHKF